MAKDTWYRVDNVAKVFLASANERDTRSFRISCTLTDEVNPEILNSALLIAAKERPQYQVTILEGFFWHYMDPTDDIPVAHEESERPCPMLIGSKTFGKLHYKVTYYRNRINLDIFHAITDGNGAFEYLNLIVNHYLKLSHPDTFPDVTVSSGASEADLSEDSFKQFYGKKKGSKGLVPKRKAYHIRGVKHLYNQVQFMEVHMPLKDVLAKSKETGVTLTSYIGTLLMMSIYRDMPALKRIMPITISMPVNLRNYYPSNTARNFFNSVCVSHIFKHDESFNDVAKLYNNDLKAQLTPEAISRQMDGYERFENFLFVKMVPLFIKNPVVNIVAKKNNRNVSAVLSNLGKLEVPKEVSQYVKSYVAFCSTSSLFVVADSYGDELVLGISSAYRNTRVLKNFITSFSKEGIPVTLYSTEIVD